MNPYRLSIYMLLFAIAFTSCYEEPEYPIEPRLTGFDGIYFKEKQDGIDTLQIRIKFEDGDGDLGLSGSGIDVEPPYNLFDVNINNEGLPIKFDKNNPDLPPYSCEDYYIIGDSLYFFNGAPLNKGDTLWVEYNKNYRNLDIRLLVKQKTGEYEVFNSPCLLSLGGRFPRLKDDFENNKKPRKGVIQYNAISTALLPLFRNDTLKLQVQIRDRALHESNIFESEPFTLRGIQVE